MAILVVFFFSFLKVWPIHFNFLRFIVIATSSCPVLTHRSSFACDDIGHKIPSIWRSLLLTNVCTLESRVLVSRQVSDP